jgi:transcriptional regulator with XRE-family HTH domain
MTTRVKLFPPSPDDFKRWRAQLGKSELEMAELAGISAEQYRAAETPEGAGELYGQIVAVFRKLGKEGLLVRGHSTLN